MMIFFLEKLNQLSHQSDAMKSGQHKKGQTNEPTTKLPIRTLPRDPNRALNHFDAPLRRLNTPRRIRTRLPKNGLHPRSH